MVNHARRVKDEYIKSNFMNPFIRDEFGFARILAIRNCWKPFSNLTSLRKMILQQSERQITSPWHIKKENVVFGVGKLRHEVYT